MFWMRLIIWASEHTDIAKKRSIFKYVFVKELEFVPLFHFLFPLVCSQTQTNIRQSKQSVFPLIQWEEIGTERIKKKPGQKNCFWCLLGFTVQEGCGTDIYSRDEKLLFSSRDQGDLIWSFWNDLYPSLPLDNVDVGRILSDCWRLYFLISSLG